MGAFTTLLFLVAMFSAGVGGTLVERVGALRATRASLLCCAVGIVLTATAVLPLAAWGALLVGGG